MKRLVAILAVVGVLSLVGSASACDQFGVSSFGFNSFGTGCCGGSAASFGATTFVPSSVVFQPSPVVFQTFGVPVVQQNFIQQRRGFFPRAQRQTFKTKQTFQSFGF